MIDNNIIDKIVKSAGIDSNTLVIEVGPGEGAISKYMVPLSGQSILYEIDNSLKDKLNFLFKDYSNKKIIIGDFLKRDIKSDIKAYDYKKVYVVANLPYYITTPIIMKFINEDVFPDKFVVMVQKEVAYRFAAKVGTKDYGSLTVFLNYFYDINILFDVSRNSFIPRPNVDSVVISMDKKADRLNVVDINLFKRIVKDSFVYKRKTIKNNLKNYNLDVVEMVLNRYGMDLGVRAENLGLEVFVALANELVNSK